jgi:hypothetical protein
MMNEGAGGGRTDDVGEQREVARGHAARPLQPPPDGGERVVELVIAHADLVVHAPTAQLLQHHPLDQLTTEE